MGYLRVMALVGTTAKANTSSTVYDGEALLENLYRFLTQIADPEMPPVPFGRALMEGRICTEKQVRSFCERLKQTGMPVNSAAARFELLKLSWRLANDEPSVLQMLAEAKDLIKLGEDRGWDPGSLRGLIPIHNALASMVDKAPLSAVRSRYKFPSMPRNPIRPTPGPERIESVRILRRHHSFELPRKCTDTMDVLWGHSRVSILPKAGILEEIFKADLQKRDRITNVRWDGENFWIATEKDGITVVSPAGKTLGRIGSEQGLPRYDTQGVHTFLSLHAVEPGKCLAAGNFGKLNRAWIALITRNAAEADSPYRVNVFHEATKVPDREEKRSAPRTNPEYADPKTAFRVGEMLEYHHPKRPGERFLLVCRKIGSHHLDVGLRPLAVNLDTLEVSVLPCPLPSGRAWCFLCTEGHILYGSSFGVGIVSPGNDPFTDAWTHKKLLVADWSRSGSGAVNPLYLHDGMIYYSGTRWHRIDPKTLEFEDLGTGPQFSPFSKEIAVSAFYGPVLISEDHFTVRIKVKPRPADDVAARYPHVPAEHLGSHHRAAIAIHKLGGFVGLLPTKDGPATQVYLSYSWQGSDADLVHLQHLYNLQAVYFIIQVPTSDEGLRHISRLENLRTLYLGETLVTDKGLVHLQALSRLAELHLRVRHGAEQFTDAGLATVAMLPRLEKLYLYGPGFTDAGLAHLKGVKTLRTLNAYDTRITAEALTKLRGDLPGLSYVQSPVPERILVASSSAGHKQPTDLTAEDLARLRNEAIETLKGCGANVASPPTRGSSVMFPQGR